MSCLAGTKDNAGPMARAEAHAEIMRRTMRIARAAVVADIQSECTRETISGEHWWDTRPMLDPREHAPDVVDMARDALDYALDTAIVRRHPHQPHRLLATADVGDRALPPGPPLLAHTDHPRRGNVSTNSMMTPPGS